MAEKFLKKIIAQNQEDLRVISALCSEGLIAMTSSRYRILETSSCLSWFALLTTVVVAVPSLLSSAHAADPADAETVGRIISQRTDLSSFLSMLEKTQLGSTLAEKKMSIIPYSFRTTQRLSHYQRVSLRPCWIPVMTIV